ncbi:virginiamycin A acetyltransferase [Palleronia salina]|uniref:Virginiamycin A acetyltransferase n=1 Tax=Palleronia salina TaxID=313368 RepID=A0A1M6G2A7_9RHOB|nr:CatB-related O-acetyltransferase [Palleronia salina]SHJ04083.1 virginiamycin A acetyltransferase [Palleronia salina]
MQDTPSRASLPDATATHPITLPDGTAHRGTVHLSRVLDHPNIAVGDYPYASATPPPEDWAASLAPYLYPGAPDRLVIGRFCQIAEGTRFITASANHATRGISTYPFPVFDPATLTGYSPDRRDIVLGHDVWTGYGSLIAPGARIGSGAIIGAGSVVRGEIPAYAVATGNPARVVRMRFDAPTVARLLDLAWWDWPIERIAQAAGALQAGDVAALARLAP